MKPEKEDKPKAAPKKPTGKVFDVSRPGKVPATPTSRPIISGHKPEAQAAQTAVSGVGEARPLLGKRKIQIFPTSDGEAKDESKDTGAKEAEQAPATPAPEAAAEEAKASQPTEQEKEALAAAAMDAVTGPPEVPGDKEPEGRLMTKPKLNIKPPEGAETPKAEEPTEVTKEEPKPEATPESTSEPETEAEPEIPKASSSVPTEAESATALGSKQEETPPEPDIKPLFDDSGSIVVSNHDYRRNHHGLKVFGLLLLIILLAAAALDLLLDLEVLNLEGVPHTDFL